VRKGIIESQKSAYRKLTVFQNRGRLPSVSIQNPRNAWRYPLTYLPPIRTAEAAQQTTSLPKLLCNDFYRCRGLPGTVTGYAPAFFRIPNLRDVRTPALQGAGDVYLDNLG